MDGKRGEGENVHLLVVVDDLAPIWPVTVLIITSISIKSIIIASHEMSKSIAKHFATLTKAGTFISHEELGKSGWIECGVDTNRYEN